MKRFMVYDYMPMRCDFPDRLFRFFKKGNNLLSRYGREIVQELVNGIPTLKIIN